MLYLGMDVHAKQITVSVLDERGVERSMRQVSTRPAAIDGFLARTAEDSGGDGGFMAMLEVCGFHGWVVEKLKAIGCRRVVVTQATSRRVQKTDRRDARELAQLLWVNRVQAAEGGRFNGVRVVEPASSRDEAARRLTTARIRAVRRRTAVVNALKRIVRRRNLQHECPTKSIATAAAGKWLRGLDLDAVDACEARVLLEQLESLQGAVSAYDREIEGMSSEFPELGLLRTIPGVGSFVGLTIACRVGTLERFPRGRSLANFWGLAPGINDSGDRRGNTGPITKRGSAAVRYALGQVVVHVLRRCGPLREWNRKVKRRRGAKKARVAVMRRLATIVHRMLRTGETFESVVAGGEAVRSG